MTNPQYDPIILNMKKELTTKQQSFLDHLIQTGGDPREAADLAGYAPNTHWQVTKALKNEIVDLASCCS